MRTYNLSEVYGIARYLLFKIQLMDWSKMTPKQVRNQLLANGYFPSELPPAFTTKSFATYVAKHGLAAFNKATECERYSNKEHKHARRILKIPNPLSYLEVCNYISDNWSVVSEKLKGSRFFHIHDYIQKEGRFIKIRFNEFEEKRLIIPSTYKYILKTDISKFYPTIYTHSIPWATEGKHQAKENHKKKKLNSFGDKLDALIRNCQGRQTLGVPIGPDTSRLIAEMIMVAIDKDIEEKLYEKVPEFDGYRLIDDYFLCFDNYGDAEQALSIIASTALEYELVLNERKTEIIPAAEWVEYLWKQELLNIKVPQENQKFSIRNYINKTFSLAKNYPGSNVIKYAVKCSQNWKIAEDAWPLYEAFLLRSVIACPSVFEEVASIFAAYKDLSYPISIQRVESTCYKMMLENLPLGNHSEVAWSLWLLKMFNITIDQDMCLELSKIENSVCACILLDIQESGKTEITLETDKLQALISDKDALCGNMWLLAYENNIRGWLTVAPYEDWGAFKKMAKSGVTFYDKEIEIEKASIGRNEEIAAFYSG